MSRHITCRDYGIKSQGISLHISIYDKTTAWCDFSIHLYDNWRIISIGIYSFQPPLRDDWSIPNVTIWSFTCHFLTMEFDFSHWCYTHTPFIFILHESTMEMICPNIYQQITAITNRGVFGSHQFFFCNPELITQDIASYGIDLMFLWKILIFFLSNDFNFSFQSITCKLSANYWSCLQKLHYTSDVSFSIGYIFLLPILVFITHRCIYQFCICFIFIQIHQEFYEFYLFQHSEETICLLFPSTLLYEFVYILFTWYFSIVWEEVCQYLNRYMSVISYLAIIDFTIKEEW